MNKKSLFKGAIILLTGVGIVNIGLNVLFITMEFIFKGADVVSELSIMTYLTYKIPKAQWSLRIIFSFLVFALILYKDGRKKVLAEKLNIGQFGNARFTTLKEIKEQYKEIQETDEEYPGEGGTLVSRHKDKLYIDDETVNTIFLGQTRSGKGELYVFPMIDILSRSEKKPSMVVNDMKGELVTATYQRLKERGYNVHIFNLVDPASSMRVNLIEPAIKAWNIGNRDEAQLIINSITHTIYPPEEMGDDVYWRDGAVSLVNGFIFACLENFSITDPGRLTLPGIVLTLQEINSSKDGVVSFLNKLEHGHPARVEAGTYLSSTEKQQSTFFSIAYSKLRQFTMDKFQKMLSVSSMDFEEIGFSNRPQAVFLVIPDYDTSNHYLASLVIRQIYDANIKRASMELQQRTRRRVHFIFDEFGNMPAIADMGSMVTAGLSRGLLFHLGLQDFQQLEKKYPNDASTIKANCGNLIYILSTDKDTLSYISERCGSITTENYSSMESKDETNIQIIERPLISTDELQKLRLWETIFLRSSKRVDLKGKPIRAHAIDNRKATKLKPRFEYLADSFPSPPEMDLPTLTNAIYRTQMEKNETLPKKHVGRLPGI